ncbi:E-selectin-like [Strongylocentrotus purpuratus]|uniref:Sushi/von Willebrand factor type A/EGF/pentraxin domain-containing 1 n=1 Tax=Strongylocentrotus purpuratus TaxID=7668 RepID=A0A7M7T1F8_STRPU|nr:E-selectin-like [Strongylocentrotus purpuratus]
MLRECRRSDQNEQLLGQWSGEEAYCEVFDSCPPSQIIYADELEDTAVVTWVEPTASDNSGETVIPVQTQGYPSGSRFSQNYHVIKYTVSDSSGLSSTCTFTFTVQVLECPVLDAPDNGDYVGGQPCQRSYGSSCYFMCNAGYFIDNNVLRCEAQPGSEEALWMGTPPTCTVETCEVPPLDNGMQYVINTTCTEQSQLELGEECEFECGNGFNLHGSEILTCGIDGEWQQQAPVCEVVTCINSDIPKPLHGIKSGCPYDDEKYGTVCRFTCDIGYLPSGSVPRTCLDDGDGNGVWSGGPVSCTGENKVLGIASSLDSRLFYCGRWTCNPLEVPVNGFIESCRLGGEETDVSTKQDYGTTCNVLCNSGYTAQGATSRRCLADEGWDGIAQSCLDLTPPVLNCPPDRVIFALAGQSKAELHWEDWEPVKAIDGSIQITATLVSIDSVPVSGNNRPAFSDEGSHIISYRATDMAGFMATCSFEVEVKVTRCAPLYPPSNGDVTLYLGQGSCEGGAVYGSGCLIKCDKGYIISDGNLTTERYCLRMSDTTTVGYWNGTQPECDAVTCAVPDIMNGHVTGCPPIEAQYQDQCEFECDDGYRSSTTDKVILRSCQANATWGNIELLCDIIVSCPANISLKYGSVTPDICTKPDPVPFDTECNFQCESGFRMYGPYSQICTSDGSWNNQRSVRCEGKYWVYE